MLFSHHTNRRVVITLLGGAAAAWPLGTRAQQPARLRTIGFLGAATPATWGPWVAAFVTHLRELGWIEGRTVAIKYRWAEGLEDRYTEISAEFVRLNVDVIVTSAPAVPAVKKATAVIPVVFAIAGDPLGMGLVESLARPGGNATGLSIQNVDTTGKRVELLREIVPALRRLAVMANIEYPAARLEMGEVRTAARKLGIEVVSCELRGAKDIATAFEAVRDRADALYLCTDPLFNTNRAQINALALGQRLPSMSGFRESVAAGSLISYGANYPDLFRHAADFVDRILHGAKPADIPVEQPTKFDLIINLKTAKALGLTIPEAFLLRADEVIE
jgi:putative ABC transport system substrate-binding protein